MGSSQHLFKMFKNDINVLIETGTFTGEGIKSALNASFEKIYSCDINSDYVERAKILFKENKNIHIINDPSSIALKQIFKDVDERCVIFLDGHSMPYDGNNPSLGYGNDTVKEGFPPCPLLQELDIIANHHIKDHIILIDDIQDFGTWVFGGITFESVKNKITQINSNYKYTNYNNTVCFYI